MWKKDESKAKNSVLFAIFVVVSEFDKSCALLGHELHRVYDFNTWNIFNYDQYSGKIKKSKEKSVDKNFSI